MLLGLLPTKVVTSSRIQLHSINYFTAYRQGGKRNGSTRQTAGMTASQNLLSGIMEKRDRSRPALCGLHV